MKKKILVLIFTLVIFTGCTPTYNLTIENSNIKEELILDDDFEGRAEKFNNTYAIVDEHKKYDYNKINQISKFSYTYSFDSINNSNMIKSCYEAFHLIEDGDTYVLQTGLKFNCLPLQISDYEFAEYDFIKVNIKVVDYEVMSNNADSVNKNVYSWTINKSNFTNKPIIMTIKKKKVENTVSKKDSNQVDMKIVIICVGTFILLITIGLLYILKINKKNNKL